MRNLSPQNQNALAQGLIVARDFIWFRVRDRDTGNPVEEGTWSDIGNVTADVIDPDSGVVETRQWYGSGTLIATDDIPLVSTLTIQTIKVHLSQLNAQVNEIVRGYDCQQGRIEIYRGLYDPNSRLMVAPAEPRFVGFIDTVEINTPAENSDGGVFLNCNGHIMEINRSNPDTRSHESQILRLNGDFFYADTAVVGTWELFWGRKQGTIGGGSTDTSGNARAWERILSRR